MSSKHKGETDEQFRERNRRYMAAARKLKFPKFHSITAPGGRENYFSSAWAIRFNHVHKNMYPECLIGLSDDEMIAEMHKRSGRL